MPCDKKHSKKYCFVIFNVLFILILSFIIEQIQFCLALINPLKRNKMFVKYLYMSVCRLKEY